MPSGAGTGSCGAAGQVSPFPRELTPGRGSVSPRWKREPRGSGRVATRGSPGPRRARAQREVPPVGRAASRPGSATYLGPRGARAEPRPGRAGGRGRGARAAGALPSSPAFRAAALGPGGERCTIPRGRRAGAGRRDRRDFLPWRVSSGALAQRPRRRGARLAFHFKKSFPPCVCVRARAPFWHKPALTVAINEQTVRVGPGTRKSVSERRQACEMDPRPAVTVLITAEQIIVSPAPPPVGGVPRVLETARVPPPGSRPEPRLAHPRGWAARGRAPPWPRAPAA